MKRPGVSSSIALAMLVLAFLTAGGSVRAQTETPPPPGAPGENVFYYQRMGPGPMAPDDGFAFLSFEGDLGGKTVTAAPFSATITTQTTQVLADGNRIERTTSGTVARDSQGRTRRDLTLPEIGAWGTSGKAAPHVVFINDSVASTQYILQPDRKTARKMQQRPRGGKHGAWTRPAGPPDGAGTPGAQKNVTTTSLGTQTINGVQAEGTRLTRTIPAGAIGNANPIVITNERWYSAELQTVVMTKRSDPRMGETTFQLTNIQKVEPDATLFQVPSDYTVKEGGPGGRKGFKHGAMPPPPPPAQD
jgi:hypothetical protein